jgi:hypothetical protein
MRKRVAAALLLLALALPTFAQRRRAVGPGTPGRCAFSASLAREALPDAMAIDDQHLYWVDAFAGTVNRVPLAGGETEVLGDLGDWLLLTLEADETSLYIGVLPYTIIERPSPGEILRLPKTGGTATTFVAGVNAPWNIAVDGTHVYWAATGTIDILNESIAPDGKIERVKKDGTQRQALAENLSAPLDVALDADSVYYGETGQADGDPTSGVFRVAKSGGSVTTVTTGAAAAELELTNDAVIFWGANDDVDSGLFRVNKNGTGLRVLIEEELLSSGPRVIDSRAYYIVSPGDTPDEIRWIDVNGTASGFVVATYLYSYDFEVDPCGVTYGDANGDIIRTRR